MAYLLTNGLLSLHVPKTAGKAWEHWIKETADVVDRQVCNQHYSYEDILKVHPELDNNDYMMTVRNPYSRIVSWYHHSRDVYVYNINKPGMRKKIPPPPPESPHFQPSFEEWVKRKELKDFPPSTRKRTNTSYGTCKSYMHPSGRMPKYLLRFETLSEDIKALQEVFNCDEPLEIQNPTVSFKGRDWRTEYKSQYTKDFIYDYFREDFEFFGYDRKFPAD